ncbi:hypothetical protein [Roseospira marina]|nr:hypothetical protein [Roseospira marina]MBB4315355.1 hypothetical protein [Roseospira marina]MBB5088354.1 hypothetical protein [Roseospira marina]
MDQTNPLTGKPFGTDIRLGLKTRDLRAPLHKRDIIREDAERIERV